MYDYGGICEFSSLTICLFGGFTLARLANDDNAIPPLVASHGRRRVATGRDGVASERLGKGLARVRSPASTARHGCDFLDWEWLCWEGMEGGFGFP